MSHATKHAVTRVHRKAPSNPPPVPSEQSLSDDGKLDRWEEQRQILLRSIGVDFSPSAWVIHNTADSPPAYVPPHLDVDALSPAELRAATALGLLRIDLMTSALRERLLASPSMDEVSLDDVKTLLQKYRTL